MAGPGTPAYPSTGGQNTHLIDEFEASFQNCIKSLTSQEYFNASDSDEVKTGVEQNTQKFLDLARQTESFFLQRRLLVSVIKPEQVVKEDIQDLRQELMKKELILSKHYEKLQQWQALMGTSPSGQAASSQQGAPHPSQSVPQGGQPSIPHPPPHPQQPTQVPGQPMMQQAHPYPGGPGPLAYLEQTMSNIGMPERR